MPQAPAVLTPAPSRLRRLLSFTLVRLVLAVMATGLAGGLTAQFVSDHTQGAWHAGWPSLCGALAALAAYAAYVRGVEQRAVSELASGPAAREALQGLAGGTALVALSMGTLALLGAYRVEAVQGGMGLLPAFAQMLFVGVFEELLMRAILFRLLERALGTRWALGVSALLFGLGHLPGNSAGALAVVVATVAGVLFAAAYLVTRRLWLPIALHTAWNFTVGSVFSIAVSGHEATAGLVRGRLQGPDWLTGGAYGLEASVVALAVLGLATAVLLRRAVAAGQLLPRALGGADRSGARASAPAAALSV